MSNAPQRKLCTREVGEVWDAIKARINSATTEGAPGCTENSSEEKELEAICDKLDAHEGNGYARTTEAHTERASRDDAVRLDRDVAAAMVVHQRAFGFSPGMEAVAFTRG